MTRGVVKAPRLFILRMRLRLRSRRSKAPPTPSLAAPIPVSPVVEDPDLHGSLRIEAPLAPASTSLAPSVPQSAIVAAMPPKPSLPAIAIPEASAIAPVPAIALSNETPAPASTGVVTIEPETAPDAPSVTDTAAAAPDSPPPDAAEPAKRRRLSLRPLLTVLAAPLKAPRLILRPLRHAAKAPRLILGPLRRAAKAPRLILRPLRRAAGLSRNGLATATRFARARANSLAASIGLLGLVAVVTVVGVLHEPTLDDAFHGDDYVAFTEFKTESFGKYTEDVFLFKDSNFYWRPLGKVLHRALYEGFGFDPAAFHVAALAIFLATVACIYAWCRREGLSVAVALVAAALFGLLPNHVVSVAWVTNTSRLLAVLCFMLSMLALQRPGRRHYLVEPLAWLLFVAAAMSDETALALAPLPLIYAGFVRASRFRWRPALLRLLAYGAVTLALVPMQFAENINDEPRLSAYSFGPHIFARAWALVSQLVLPLTDPLPGDIILKDIPAEQWGAGLAAIVVACLLMAVGSKLLRFVIIWAGLALAPFTLWDLTYTSPRYVYMAAVPYAIIVSWLGVSLLSLAAGTDAWRRRARRIDGWAVRAALAAGLVAAAVALGSVVEARNDGWSKETERYGQLARGLEKELPNVPSGSRIVIVYGTWPDFWATSIAQTIYGDRSIRVLTIPPERANNNTLPPFGTNDRVLYFMGGQLISRDAASQRR